MMWFVFSSYDVVFTEGADTIKERFAKMDARVVFSAEGFCWPDRSLAVRTCMACEFCSLRQILVLLFMAAFFFFFLLTDFGKELA